jgi:hypothetical protein
VLSNVRSPAATRTVATQEFVPSGLPPTGGGRDGDEWNYIAMLAALGATGAGLAGAALLRRTR